MVHLLRNLFVKSIIFYASVFLISNDKNFAASISPSDNEIFLVRNTLNPYQYQLINELVEKIKNENPENFHEQKAFEEAQQILPTLTGFPYFSHRVFYQYDPKINPQNISYPYEGIIVNPDLVSTRNEAFRVSFYRENARLDEEDYKSSRIPLRKYIEQRKIADSMKEKLESGKIILFHPLTGKPMTVNPSMICGSTVTILDQKIPKHWEYRHFQYPNTIPIHLSLFDKIAKRKIPCTKPPISIKTLSRLIK